MVVRRVLLISTNTYATPDAVFPLGMAHVAAALTRAGYEVLWQDQLAHPRPIEELIRRERPDVIGISIRNIDDVQIRTRTTLFNGLDDLCRRIRQVSDSPIILGGSGFSVFPHELLAISGADYGIRGEGDLALVTLLKALETGRRPVAVPGLVYRAPNGVVTSTPSAPLRHTDIAPLQIGEEQTRFYIQHGGMLNVQTQRGCAHRCCYCTYPVIEGRARRTRTGEEVARDFQTAISAGARYIFIVDSVFNSSPGHVQSVCEAILHKNLKVRWGCFLRPQGLTPETMKLMARAGLSHVEFGSDSFSDDVLKASGKGFTFEEVLYSSELARNENIDYCHFLIAGGPGETQETLSEGFRNSQKLVNAIIMAVVGMRIYPGTPLFDHAVSERLIEADADLTTPAFYLAKGLHADQVFGQLKQFASQSPNWIVGDTTPAYVKMVERLRSRGVVGPLWGYLSMVQRLMPSRLGEHPVLEGGAKSQP